MTEQNQITKIKLATVSFGFHEVTEETKPVLAQRRIDTMRSFLNENLAKCEQLYDQRGWIVAHGYEGSESTCEPGEHRQHLDIYAVWGGNIPQPEGRQAPVDDPTLKLIDDLFDGDTMIVPFFLDDQYDRVNVIQATRHCEALWIGQGAQDHGAFIFSQAYVCQHDMNPEVEHVYHIARRHTDALGNELQRQVPHAFKTLPAWIITQTTRLSNRVVGVHEYLLFTDQFGPVLVDAPDAQEKAVKIADYVLEHFGDLFKVGHSENSSIHVGTLVIPEETNA